MENLIKLQALIQQIERLTLESEYHSSFLYHDDTTLIIQTFCSRQTIAIYQMFQNTRNICLYLEENTKIKVIDLEREPG